MALAAPVLGGNDRHGRRSEQPEHLLSMTKSPGTESQMLDLEVTGFLSEFARYLVAAGMTCSRFESLLRAAFFEAAAETSKFSNKRVNHSAVAAMTGLTRVQVRSLAARAPRSYKRSRLDRIVDAWMTDVEFVTSNYRPRRLDTRGKGRGFSNLIRKHGGDVPPKSILRELERNGLVAVRGGYAYLEPSARIDSAKARLKHVSALLGKLLTSEGNVAPGPASPMRSAMLEIVYPASSAKGRILMQKRLAKSLRSFAAEIQAAGSATSIEAPPVPAHKGMITRTRIALIAEDFN